VSVVKKDPLVTKPEKLKGKEHTAGAGMGVFEFRNGVAQGKAGSPVS